MNEIHRAGAIARPSSSMLASNEPFRSRALLLLRGYVGSAVLLAHGLPKILELSAGERHFVELVAGLGLPAPGLFAWLVSLTQLAGGAAVVVGLATRVAASAVASTIGIGMIGVHLHDPFEDVEAGVAYVVALIAIALLGPGELSLDRFVRGRGSPRGAATASEHSMIHVAITRRVRSGSEREFEDALRKFFHQALAEPTTSGASLILPGPGGVSREYGVLRSFPSEAAKDAFYRSDTYRRWEREVAPLVEGEVSKHELHGLEAFFRSDGAAQPPAWKMALLTWLAVNPAVWIWSQIVPRALSAPPLLLMLVVNVFVVATLTWLFMPALVRVFRTWLR